MKKIILLISIVFVSVLLIGCGKKHQLTCTMTQNGAESKIIAYFNNKEDRLVKMHMSLSMDLGNKKAANKYKKTACEDSEYDSCKVEVDGTKVTISYEQKKINKDEQSTLADAKKELEEEGFTCTK